MTERKTRWNLQDTADEIERLRAERDVHAAEECELREQCDELLAMLKILAAEIGRLRAINAELLAVLKLANDEYHLGYSDTTAEAICAAIVKAESKL